MKARACSYSCRGVRVDVEEVVVVPADSGADVTEDSGAVVSEDPVEEGAADSAEESTVEPAGKSAVEEEDSPSAWTCVCPASVGLSELLQAANAKTAKAIVR